MRHGSSDIVKGGGGAKRGRVMETENTERE